ncbi:unnamed protein product [Owenia fusiformis]|uniref:Uncharacterized protein n=1 Tax=Owenia fusiformis TaxID=6347 RepID=A0A8S4PYR3_OWEFU|nr:unnamed protein product [Owenia fusiformis]
MILVVIVALVSFDAVHTTAAETYTIKRDVLLLREELKIIRDDILNKSPADFKTEVNNKMQSLDDKVSEILRKLDSSDEGRVMWGDWGDWSACDTSKCNIVYRERPCLGEGGNELDPSRCTRFGGKHTDNKQCCDIDVKSEYKKIYSGNGSVPAYIVKATGSNVKVEEREKLSWVVSLKFKKSGASDYEHSCGGVILSNIWVLTAAHCITKSGCWDKTEKKVTCDMGRWRIAAGEWKLDKTHDTEQITGLEHIVVHQNYSVNHFREIEYINDIALIKLNRPLEFMFNPFVQPSLLPARTCIEAMDRKCLKTHRDFAMMTYCFTTGWGEGPNKKVTNKGNTIEVQIEENENHAIVRSERIDREKVICMGYSGSPLMCDVDTATMDYIPNQKMVVLGLNSYIYPSGCIRGPTNYTHTSLDYHMKWISQTVMEWIKWSPWSRCFKNNKRSRLRSGFFPEYGYLPGQGPLYQSYQRDVLKKEEQNCTNGAWTQWKGLTDCSVTCGVGTMSESRTCIPPVNGGRNCIGKSSKIISCEKRPCFISTPNDRMYRHQPINVTGKNFIKFNVKACHDAHVILQQKNGNTNDKGYDVLLHGRKLNPQSGIRNTQLTKFEISYKGSTLSCSEMRPFWVSWANGNIQVGRGHVYGEDFLMGWQDPIPNDIDEINFITDNGANGTWEDKGANLLIHDPVESRYIRTPDYFGYRHVPIDISGKNYIKFKVEACNDAHLELQETPYVTNKNNYEIVLNGWSRNPNSGIRDKPEGSLKVSHRGSILNCTEMMPFWVSWMNGDVQVGKGHAIGQNIILAWQDPTSHVVNALNFVTGFGASGTWEIVDIGSSLLIYDPFESRYIRTPDYFGYRHVPIDVSGRNYIKFKVEACNDAHLELQETPYVTNKNNYQIVLNGWSWNPNSGIRDRPEGSLKVSHRGSILNCTEMMPFWVSWANGNVQVGKGHAIGQNTFLAWQDPTPHVVNALNFVTGFGASGTWKIVYETCAVGQVEFNSACYLITTEKKTQKAAQAVCRAHRGHLTSILSANENAFLAVELEKTFRETSLEHFYIGLSAKGNNYNQWSDGNDVVYTKWSKGEPSTEGEECVTVERYGGFEWHDIACVRSEASICKSKLYVEDCSQHSDGTAYIATSDLNTFQTKCKGGWLVFANRFDGSVDFNKNWTEYRNGFGNIDGEYFLGLKNIRSILKQGKYKLRVELTAWPEQQSQTRYADYSDFNIGSEDNGFKLTALGYSGTARDSLYHSYTMKFSTKDVDHDTVGHGSCAHMYSGAWWYNRCTRANLFGNYMNTSQCYAPNRCIFWWFWPEKIGNPDNAYYSFKEMRMMLTPL